MLHPFNFDEEASQPLNRCTFIGAITAVLLSPLVISFAPPKPEVVAASQSAKEKLAKLQSTLGGRLGVFILDIANCATLRYRADERFPLAALSRF